MDNTFSKFSSKYYEANKTIAVGLHTQTGVCNDAAVSIAGDTDYFDHPSASGFWRPHASILLLHFVRTEIDVVCTALLTALLMEYVSFFAEVDVESSKSSSDLCHLELFGSAFVFLSTSGKAFSTVTKRAKNTMTAGSDLVFGKACSMEWHDLS